MPDANSLKMVDYTVWNQVSANLAAAGTIPEALGFVSRDAMMEYIDTVVTPFIASEAYAPYLAPMAGLSNLRILFWSITIYVEHNGLFLLPLISMGTQLVMQKLTMQQTAAANPQQAGSQKSMIYIMLFMSLYFCAQYNAAFALYWVISNVYAIAEQLCFNKYFKVQEAKSATAEEVGI
jgi:membrane protein insertase Oxa1/YidC/SpoIIIJ